MEKSESLGPDLAYVKKVEMCGELQHDETVSAG
jgi:hypothetical protein